MSRSAVGDVLINGVPYPAGEAAVSVFDIGFQRGYGCFESMRTYGGFVFRLDRHLARLTNSADSLRIPLPSKDDLTAWCTSVGAAGDGVLKVIVTGGTDPRQPGTDSSVIVYQQPLPVIPESIKLDIVSAPWHGEGMTSELTGSKTLSYGPNLAATITALERGFDDAVLVSGSDIVLEGPTFSVGWIRDETLHTPALDTHILASITREATLEVAAGAGLAVEQGSFNVSDLLEADEAFVMSTVREVMPARAIGPRSFPLGPVTKQLKQGFAELVASEVR